MPLSPIALFAYRRPRHLQAVLNALRTNPEAKQTALYVFSDGPKDDAAAENVREVRRILSAVAGFASVEVIIRAENVGLARNITEGVSGILERHPSVIVVEDDIVVSPYFLRYMNEALACYSNTPRVGSISAYCYPVSWSGSDTYFIRGADCWGWATWRDRWACFNPDGRALLRQLRERNLTSAFDFDGAMGFTEMLEDQVARRNDSWAVRWHASCFLNDLLILYPARALAQNIGHDGSGTHSANHDEFFDIALSSTPVAIEDIPIEESASGRAAIRAFFAREREMPTPLPQSPPIRRGLLARFKVRIGRLF